MRSRAISALIAIVVLASLASGPVAAINASNASDVVDEAASTAADAVDDQKASDDGNRTVPADSERIEPGLMLIDATYNSETGMAALRFAVASTRSLTLVDAGAFMQGGEVARRVEVLHEGRHTLKIPVTEVDGMVGVSVSTADTLYAVPIETGAPDIVEGDPTWQTVHLAGGAGLGGALLIVGLVAWRRARGGREEVTRVA